VANPEEAEKPGAAHARQSIDATRDLYIAEQQVVVNLYPPPAAEPAAGRPRVPGPDGETRQPGLGQQLFTKQIPRSSEKFFVAFGVGDTLVATANDGSVRRWSLRSQAELPGAAASSLPLPGLIRAETDPQVAVCTTAASVAFSRGPRVALLHFADGGYRIREVPLRTDEYLVPIDGDRFATVDRGGVKVRDYADGSVIWEAPAPVNISSAIMDPGGRVVAMAGAPHPLAGTHRVVVVSQDDPEPRQLDSSPLVGPGCQLGISADGALVACASAREVVVARPRTGEIVHRRLLGNLRKEVAPARVRRRQRLICRHDGQVLWLHRGRVVDVNWPGADLEYLQQDGCDDIAYDHRSSRLATVSSSGQVDVFQWRLSGFHHSPGWAVSVPRASRRRAPRCNPP
jgi:hypothetical protein